MNFLINRCKHYLSWNSNSDRIPPNSSSVEVSEEVVAELVIMGFGYAEVVKCLKLANNNKELACEYLLTGIPDIFPDVDCGESISSEKAEDFKSCKSREEKIAWLQSDKGQLILKERPVLLEFYENGQLFRMLDNPRWKDTLNEWLTSTSNNKPQKLIRRRKKRKVVWFHTPNSVSSPQVVFRNEIQKSILKVPISSKYELLTEGFCVFRNIVPVRIVDAANAVINGILSEQFQQQRLKKETGKTTDDDDDGGSNDPNFVSGSTNDSAVMALFYASHIFHYVQDLLYGDSQHNKQSHCGGAQVAFRFSQPRPLNWQRLGGLGWHLDGLEEGRLHAFSLLIGVALNDQENDFSGNLCLHPGSHYALRDYLRCYAERCHEQQLAAGGSPQQEYPDINVPRPDLGEPVQVSMRKGDVVFALHKTAHRGGPNYSTEVRRMVYFRVSHVEHGRLKVESLQNIWAEFAGMQEVL